MSYETYRVEITRDETVAVGGLSVEITAYIDRVAEHNDYTVGMLTRVPKGVWNSRLQFAGDFDELSAALAAVSVACPEVEQIRCYEYTIDNEYPVEVTTLIRIGDEWAPLKD